MCHVCKKDDCPDAFGLMHCKAHSDYTPNNIFPTECPLCGAKKKPTNLMANIPFLCGYGWSIMENKRIEGNGWRCRNTEIKKEFISCAAIKFMERIFALERPYRHHDVIWFINDETGCRLCDHPYTQGFLTNRGRFVDRKEAEYIARECGQVTSIIGSVLTSEDMW